MTDSQLLQREAVEYWLRRNWLSPVDTFHVEVEGAKLACRGWNLASREMPLIVLVHGFRAHARWWDHIAPALCTHHRVVALDLSGMGDSGRRSSYSRAQFGREILATAAFLGDSRPCVIAHSFGAVCAALADRAQPERMHRLIVIDSAFPAQGESRQAIRAGQSPTYQDAASARARFRLLPPGRWPDPLILDYIAEHSIVRREDGWTWKFDGRMADYLNAEHFYSDLFGLSVPIDLIYGEQTEVMTEDRRAAVRTMASDIGEEIAIPTCHHHVLIEQPIALVAALRALLANGRYPSGGSRLAGWVSERS